MPAKKKTRKTSYMIVLDNNHEDIAIKYYFETRKDAKEFLEANPLMNKSLYKIKKISYLV